MTIASVPPTSVLQETSTQKEHAATFAMWSACFEAFCHQLLYTRRVYPKESFCRTRFLGIQCQANRHPDVIDYIHDSIVTAVHALQQNDATEISVVICSETRDYEVYSLEFFSTGPSLLLGKGEVLKTTPSSALQEMEKEIQTLLLSVLAMEGRTTKAWPPSTSFQIRLYVPSEPVPKGGDASKTGLGNALHEGLWFCPKTEEPRSTESRRPVCTLPNAKCRFMFRNHAEDSKEPNNVDW